MAGLNLCQGQAPYKLAANLRRAFSGIVAGNVKEYGIQMVAQKGPFKLHGDQAIINFMGKLMTDFIEQGRILLSQREYVPCYELDSTASCTSEPPKVDGAP